jgi:photosystem II stability/assembly factor-like uncharacterized protein
MKPVPILAATALAVALTASAASVTTPVNDAAAATTAAANPLGAEEWMFVQRANSDGSIPDAAVTEAIAQSNQMGTAAMGSPSTDQVWGELGPSNIGGRIRDIAADPTTSGVVYIATGTGGLWRSNDAGATFGSAWDDQLPQSMGAVAVDSEGVVWAGTGEPDHGGGSSYYGKGVYKSTDGGATWSNMGLRSGDTIGQIVIDPRDDDRVFVAVMGALHDTEPTRGLFMTENGGLTWTRVIVPDSSSTGAIDVTINKANPDIMLATTWDKIRDEKSRIYGKKSFVYRSTDGGLTWTNIHSAPLPQSVDIEGQPVTATYVGRMGVDFSDSDPNRAYLISSTAGGNFNGFFTSTDAGATWTPVGATSGGTLQSISGGFAWWFGRVYVDPVDPQHVFAAGVSLAESRDGGLTWTTSQTPHADQHGLEWDPFTPGKVYLGNDGGFYWSTENGGCRGFVDGAGFTMTIPGARKNWVAPLEFAADTRFLFGGSEVVNRINTDAGQRVWQAISPDLTEGTEPRAPGFGTVTAIGTTPADPNLVYAGTDSGLMWVSRNAMAAPGQVTWQKLESPVFPGRWVTRITVDPQNPAVAWASFSGWRSGDPYPHLVMTRDGGKTWADIAGKRIPQAPINDVIRHPSKKNWLFIATDVGVFRTTNLGKTWIKVGANLPLVPINDIDLPAGSDTLYAATYGRSIWTTSIADAD